MSDGRTGGMTRAERNTVAAALEEIERLTRERDEARADYERLSLRVKEGHSTEGGCSMWAIIKHLRRPGIGIIETVIVTDDRHGAIERAVLLAADSDMLADREDDTELDLVTRLIDGSGYYGTRDIDIFLVRAFRS